MMTTEQAKPNRLRDLAVSAGVATVVSAFLAPWIQRFFIRWQQPAVAPQPTTTQPQAPEPDPYLPMLDRLIDGPEAVPQLGETTPAPRKEERNG